MPIVLMLGVSLSLLGGLALHTRVQASWEDKLILRSERNMALIKVGWAQLVGRVSGVASLVAVSQQMDPAEFQNVSQELMADFPSIRAVGYMPLNGTEELSFSHSYPLDEAFGFNGYALAGLAAQLDSLIDNDPQSVRFVSPRFIRGGAGVVNGDVLLSHLVINNDKVVGVVLARLDPLLFTRSILERTLSIGTGFAIELKQNGTALRPPLEDFRALRRSDLRFTHTESLVWGGMEWKLHWYYGGNFERSPASFLGALVTLLGLAVTVAILWVFWSQHRIAEHIRREVEDRTKQLEMANRKFRQITSNAYDLIAIVNPKGEFDYVNSAYSRVLGFAEATLRGTNIADLVHPEDRPYLEQMLDKIRNWAPFSMAEFRMRHRVASRQTTNGSEPLWYQMEAVAKGLYERVSHYGGPFEGQIVIHIRDVQRLMDFAEAASDWLWEVDRERHFTYVSPSIAQYLGDGASCAVVGHDFASIFKIDPNDTLGTSGLNAILDLMGRGEKVEGIEINTRNRHSELVSFKISAVPVRDSAGRVTGYRGATTDVTAAKKDQDNLKRLATTDTLTGLFNRAYFMDQMNQISNPGRRHSQTGVILFIDLDRFKIINDTHGHEAGDAILIAVADLLRKSLRLGDTIARLGGDEFAVIMRDIDIKDAQQKVARIVDGINSLNVIYNGNKLQVTMSVGMIAYPQPGKDTAQLINSADLAMYKAKELGRNRLFIDATGQTQELMSSAGRTQMEWIDRLRRSLAHDSFEMHYQPMIPSQKGRPTIYEALIRLRDEHGNLGAPALFIDAAENFGLINQLDRAVIARCLKQQAEVRRQTGKSITLSLNLSSLSFGDKELLALLQRAMIDHKTDPTTLIFEVTETAAMRDLGEANAFVTELKRMGCRFAIDDFGAGFSSFSYIKNLDLDYIKIDGSYIRNMHNAKDDRLFVKALVDLAKGLGIHTVAEFVENSAVVDILIELGVDYMQGYYLGRPEAGLEGLVANVGGFTTADYATGTPRARKTGSV